MEAALRAVLAASDATDRALGAARHFAEAAERSAALAENGAHGEAATAYALALTRWGWLYAVAPAYPGGPISEETRSAYLPLVVRALTALDRAERAGRSVPYREAEPTGGEVPEPSPLEDHREQVRRRFSGLDE